MTTMAELIRKLKKRVTIDNHFPLIYDKIKHAKEKQAAAKQTFVFRACFNENADLRSKSKKLRGSGHSS